jgi:GNAT superfamily N-acetyltransferase
MTVRLREPADLRLCVDVLAAVHHRDTYPLQWPADPVSWLTPPGLISAWVAEVDGELVGHVALICTDSSKTPPRGGQAELSKLFVSPTVREHGVGAADGRSKAASCTSGLDTMAGGCRGHRQRSRFLRPSRLASSRPPISKLDHVHGVPTGHASIRRADPNRASVATGRVRAG